MKKMMSVAAAAMVATSFASAEGQTAFNGAYAGAEIGLGLHNTKLTVQGVSGKYTESMNGFIAGLVGGFNLRSNDLVVGIEAHAQKDFSSKTIVDEKRTIQYNLGAGLRLGYVFAQDMMVFAKVGFDHMKLQSRNTVTKEKDSFTKTPFTVGAGLEKSFGQYSLRIAYDWSRIKRTVQDDPTDPKITTTFNNHKVLVGAVYNF